MSSILRSTITHRATRSALPNSLSKSKPILIHQSRLPSSTSHLRMSSTSSVPDNVQQFLDFIKIRRSNYTLSKETTIPDSGVQSIIEQALEEVPSTFGAYTTRIVLVTGDQHDKFWDLTAEIVKGVTPAEQWAKSTSGKLAGFKAGHGTILFFESPESTRALQDKYPFIKDKFPEWSMHTNAMHQFVIWTALTVGGNGANLQHYNPLIDERVKTDFNLPADWQLIGQLVYGKPVKEAGPKPTEMKKPMSERLVIPGKQ